MANVVFVDIIALFNYGRRAKRVFLTVLCIWSTMYERILNSFSDILLTMTALWFRSLVRSFLKIAADPTSPPDKVSRRLSSDHLLRLTEYCAQVIQNYGRVKYLVERVNSATALIIGSFVIGNLPFYVTNVFHMFSDKNIFLRLRYLFYCSYYFPSLFLAAKSSRQVNRLFEDAMTLSPFCASMAIWGQRLICEWITDGSHESLGDTGPQRATLATGGCDATC